jgi:hypothetical protein
VRKARVEAEVEVKVEVEARPQDLSNTVKAGVLRRS